MLCKITVNYETTDKNSNPITITTLFYVVKDTIQLGQEYIQSIITNGDGTLEINHEGETYTVNKNTGVIISSEEQTN